MENINNAKKRNNGGSILKFSVTINDVTTTHTTEKIVATVMKTCDKKFMLAHYIPLMNVSDICNDAGFDGSSPEYAQIKAGTYTFPLVHR